MLPRHLMTLADLTPVQIERVLLHALKLKKASRPWVLPQQPRSSKKPIPLPPQSLFLKTIALLFSKRSTRTRLAAETSAELLGGKALFLGQDDIQLGVNESPRDTALVVSSMCQGIFARVGDHEEIEELARYSAVPVLNALSSLWHPTQVLADLLTLHEHAAATPAWHPSLATPPLAPAPVNAAIHLQPLRPLTIAYVGDSANVLHDMLVTYPRLGHSLRVASPPQYRAPQPVWDRVTQLGIADDIVWTEDPREALQGADVVVTDTWISMGQEAEKAERLKAFQGYQITEELCKGVARPDWMFLHCLPRKQDEVDDEVFYGRRSLAFPEAENRKWTIMALFDLMFGKNTLYEDPDAVNVKKGKESKVGENGEEKEAVAA